MISSTWIELILELTLKTVLVLGIAFFILLIGKRFSFATRHLILTFAVVNLLLLPLISHMLPAWNISVLPSFLPQEIQSADTTLTAQLESAVSPSGSGLIPDSRSDPFRAAHPNPVRWPVLVFIGWFAGASFVSLRLIAGLIGSRLMIYNASPVSDFIINAMLVKHSGKLGIKRKVRLLQTPKTAIPLTCGWLHPIILLPLGASDWNEKRKEIVLVHELAHVKRGDFFLFFLTRMASILYWFNPLVWIAIKQLAIEREHASDDCVLAAGTKASEYASHLLEIAKRTSSLKWFSPAGITIAKKSNLEARIMSILNNTRPEGRIRLSTIFLTGFFALSLLFPIASVRTWAKNDTAQEKEQEKTEESTDIQDKEEIKKALKEFFAYIERLDFSNALRFFADDPEIEITEDVPIVIIKPGKKSGDKHIRIYTVDDLKKIRITTKINTITKNYATVKINGNIAVIGTDKADIKHIFFKKAGGHTFVLNYKDGKWKLCADVYHLNFVKDDVDKESKKVGLCFTEDGVTYIIIRVSPSITIVKQEKKKEEKKKLSNSPH